jgi:predicted CXXCH cytochrome family protein
MTGKQAFSRMGIALLALVLVGGTAGYVYVVHGGMSARQKPGALEAFFASRLVNLGIPAADRARTNPLASGATSDDVAAGRDLYVAHCQACHGTDGMGKTAAGAAMYPRPAALGGDALAKRTDGELFHLIRDGIRNTGMPGWSLPDREIWQLVLVVRRLPLAAEVGSARPATLPLDPKGLHYVGSAACQPCHAEIYDRWKKTLMANVVRDPHEHPEAVLPDFSKADPAIVKFAIDDVALVYGTRWKQRYFKREGGDYYAFPAQWDVTNKAWKPYYVKDDWWAPLYPPDNFARPTSALCDGCHSVNYDVATRTPTEWNVGCEKCHGPGGDHAASPKTVGIVNPARLDYVAASDTCIQCHSQGRPPGNPIDGKVYDWPVGFHMGMKLADYWTLEEHKLGETTFTHFADGTAHKNRMQGNDFVQSLMYTRGVSCLTCHDAHGSPYEGMLRKPADTICLDCHGPASPNGPHAPTLESHTHHAAVSAGSQCVACHMPKIAQTLGAVNVRSHTFRFVGPALTDASKIPNACNVCHTDKPTSWTAAALKTWQGASPWRMAE